MKTIRYSFQWLVKPQGLSLVVAMLLPASAWAEYYFDPSLLQGSSVGQDVDISRFNQASDALAPGDYLLDIYVNQQLIRNKVKISLSALPAQPDTIEPCLPAEIVDASAIRVKKTSAEPSTGCLFISQLGPKINWNIDTSKLRLDMTIPQAGLYHNPRGYIPVSEWDAGASALYLRHNTNFYHTENTASHFRYDYLWSNINGGINAGLWQLNHQGNLRYSDNSLAGASYKYNSVRTWVQRPLPIIDSVVSFGDNYTNSSLFGSLSFNGIKLSTDQRMWPQGKRGYAPEVRGIAATTARVRVSQQDKVIYETTVPPGAFVINDLYNTKSQGDLKVDVIEANGQVSTFTVPYSAVPDSVRPGSWNYELAMGHVRSYYSVENKFLEGVIQRGVNNYLTANIGTRVAENYTAGLLGGVIATPVGAFGLNSVYSQAKAENNKDEHGWRIEASYSKTFTTGTNLVLAAYRYSTSGYRDLQDVLGVRRQEKSGVTYYSDTLQQRNNLSATIGQPLGDWGMLNLTGSTADYYNNNSRITQLQMGYSTSWRNININLNVARQRNVYSSSYYTSVNDRDFNTDNKRKYTENTLSLGFSIPLDFGNSRSQLTFDMNKSNNNRSATTGLSGTFGENNSTSYSMYAGMSDEDQGGNTTILGGNIERRTSLGSLRGSVSKGQDYRQFGLGSSGTLVFHSGGVTAGPYTSDTFALIEAPGAQGAAIRNGQGAVVDRFGYALLPSLTPYRYNNVSLDVQNMNDDVELQGGSMRVVPYAGAISRVKFDTISGKAVLINTLLPGGGQPPMGAEVTNNSGSSVGIVGQGGQIYARLAAESGSLYVMWGKKNSQRCRVDYRLPSRSGESLYQLDLPCHQE